MQIRVFRTAARRKLEQFIPIEIDFDQARRQRQNGIRGPGQMLKSFRDRPVDFPVYPAKAELQEFTPIGCRGIERRAGSAMFETAAARPPQDEEASYRHQQSTSS